MIRHKFVVIAALATLASGAAFAPGLAQAASVTLSATADTELGERPGEDRGAAGGGVSVNMRTITSVGGNRNEMIALKFDLTGIDFADVTAATLKMTWHRNANANGRPWVLYGINDGAVGADNNTPTTPAQGFDDNTWAEATVRMSTMPGLVYDGDSTTQGIVATDTTNLGTGNYQVGTVNAGVVHTFSAASLLSFLSAHPDDVVSLLLATPSNSVQTGQERFATKETTTLDFAGAPVMAAGTYAPILELTLVPEPASAALATCMTLALARIARRKRS